MTTNYLKVSLITFLLMSCCIFTHGQNRKEDVKRTNDIIQYANSVVGLNDIYTASLSNYQQLIAAADLNINKLNLGNPASLTLIDCNKLQIDEVQAKAYHQNMEGIATFPQKSELDKLVFQAENISQNVYTYCTQLNNYFSQGAYQQDANFRQYSSIKNNIMNAIVQASISWNKASHTAVGVANEAEINLLKYEERADFLIPMKTDITALKNLLNMFGTGAELDIPFIQQKIQNLESSLSVNKSLAGKDLSKLKDSSYQNVYGEFYKNCESSLSIIKTLTQQIAQNSNMEEIQQSFNYAKSAYSEAINSYNTFIKQK